MIVWLASYPRSGNTLFRIILNRLGLGPTYSVYSDPPLKDLGLVDLVGHEDLPEKGLRDLARLRKPVFVKTHRLPEQDDWPAVYLVRDGRDAIVSFAHYLKDIAGKNAPLEQLIGQLIMGTYKGHPRWWDHVIRWTGRPNVTVVRYEELIKQPDIVVSNALRNVAAINVETSDVTSPSFDELRNKSARFFREGRIGTWRADMSASMERHFWRWNDIGMKAAGYEMPPMRHRPIAETTIPTTTFEDLGVQIKALADPILEGVCMPPFSEPVIKKDFYFLLSLAQKMQPKEVFEFGTGEGNTVANLCMVTSAQITTLNALSGNTSGAYRTYDLNENEVGWVYKKRGYENRVVQIYGDSIDFCPEAHVGSKMYDLVIIDGCHDYEYVLNDFLSIYGHVTQDGCVLFHDTDPDIYSLRGAPWRACAHLRKAGFDISHVEDTLWGYWSPRDQKRTLDREMLSVLDYMVEGARERRDTRKNFREAEDKLDRIRRIPGYWLARKMLNKAP